MKPGVILASISSSSEAVQVARMPAVTMSYIRSIARHQELRGELCVWERLKMLAVVVWAVQKFIRPWKLKRWLTCTSRWKSHLLLRRGLLLTLCLLLLRPGSLSRSLDLGGLGAVVLRDGLDNGGLVLGLEDGDGVRQGLLGASLALRVGAAHDLDLDTEDTLAEQDVTGGAVDELLGGLTGVDHEAVGELHGFGTGGTELARDDDLATLGAGLHDETQDTVAGTTDSKTIEQLVAEGLALGDGGQTTVLDLGGIEGNAVLGELEALLDEGGELADTATLLTKDLLGVGGSDNDVGNGRGDADLDAGVSLLGQLALEELVQLGVEDTVSDELSPLGAVETIMSARGSRISGPLSLDYMPCSNGSNTVESLTSVVSKAFVVERYKRHFPHESLQTSVVLQRSVCPTTACLLLLLLQWREGIGDPGGATHIWAPGTAMLT
jgi:hypothetical protein